MSAATQMGWLNLTAGRNCKGARLLVNKVEKEFGQEIELTLNEEHEYEVHREGYVSVVEKFTLTEEIPTKSDTVNLTLRKYSLTVRTNVENATIKAGLAAYSPDKQYSHGTTVNLTVSAEGYVTQKQSVTMTDDTEIEFVLVPDRSNDKVLRITTDVEGAKIVINGTESNEILESMITDNKVSVSITKEHHTPINEELEVTEELYESGKSYVLEPIIYEVRIFTNPETAIIHTGDITQVYNDKILRGKYGEVLPITVQTVGEEFAKWKVKTLEYTITDIQQDTIQLEPEMTYIVVEGGGKLENATIRLKLGKNEYTLKEGVKHEFQVEFLPYTVEVSQYGYETYTESGNIFDNKVTIVVRDWEAVKVTFDIADELLFLDGNLFVKYPKDTKPRKMFVRETEYVPMPIGSEVNFTIRGQQMAEEYVSPVYTINEDTEFSITPDMVKLKEKEVPMIEMVVEAHYVWKPEPGIHRAKRIINGEELPLTSTTVHYRQGTEINLVIAFEGYHTFETTFTLNEPVRIDTAYYKENFKMILNYITFNVTPSDADILLSYRNQKVENGVPYGTTPTDYEMVVVSKEGYVTHQERVEFDVREKTINIELKEVPKKTDTETASEEYKPNALKNTLTEEEKFDWFENLYTLMLKRNLYKHLRIGIYLKRDGVTETGCEKFYKTFGKYLSTKLDYQIYNLLRDYYDGPVA